MSKKRTTKQYRKNRPLRMENLEGRKMFAADIAFHDGVLEITGTDGDDQIVVSQRPNQREFQAQILDANQKVIASKTLRRVKIDQININALDGSDEVHNNTKVSSVVYGGHGDDMLYGGSSSDKLIGGAGEDFLDGSEGNDNLNGGSGRDVLVGGADNDTLLGGAEGDFLFGDRYTDPVVRNGNDILKGGSGDDALHGGGGNDTLEGGRDDDHLYGEDGIDTLKGGSGDDKLRGGDGNDRLYGGSNNDSLYGGSGWDRLWGEGGNDGLFGGIGEQDNLYGGTGADRYLVPRLSNGNPEDFVFSGGSSEDVRINFSNGEATCIVLGSNIGAVNVTAGEWTDGAIEEVDYGLEALHKLTGNTRMLKQSDGVRELNFVRRGRMFDANSGEEVTHRDAIGWTDSQSITLVDNTPFKDQAAIHLIAHNWDESHENAFVTDFRNVAGWQQLTGPAPGFEMARDQAWAGWGFEDKDDDLDGFARNHGKMNPLQDFATSFTAYVMAETGRTWYSWETPAETRARMTDRFAVLDDFFASLS